MLGDTLKVPLQPIHSLASQVAMEMYSLGSLEEIKSIFHRLVRLCMHNSLLPRSKLGIHNLVTRLHMCNSLQSRIDLGKHSSATRLHLPSSILPWNNLCMCSPATRLHIFRLHPGREDTWQAAAGLRPLVPVWLSSQGAMDWHWATDWELSTSAIEHPAT